MRDASAATCRLLPAAAACYDISASDERCGWIQTDSAAAAACCDISTDYEGLVDKDTTVAWHAQAMGGVGTCARDEATEEVSLPTCSRSSNRKAIVSHCNP